MLGILAVNIAGFAGPTGAVYSPDVPQAGTATDHAVFAAVLVLFEGKMRTLFSILFGASLLLFIERAEEAGNDGQQLELRRLGWLALFGYLHFLLLWWGDILFLYAFAGLAALALRHLSTKTLMIAALLMFTVWQLEGTATDFPFAEAEAQAATGSATTEQTQTAGKRSKDGTAKAEAELHEYRSGFLVQIGSRLTERPFRPLGVAFVSIGETLPYMLLGMALLRSGFFSGGWPVWWLRWTAIAGAGLGGGWTLAFAVWAWRRGFPQEAMQLAINYGLGFPHLLMALGYAAMLVLATPRLLATRLGTRLRAAGRMALSNYIGTSVVMTAIFYGWGLGLVGTLGRAGQLPFVLLGWMLMLAWSKPWLARFRLGPLEWLWRSLTDCRILPLQR